MLFAHLKRSNPFSLVLTPLMLLLFWLIHFYQNEILALAFDLEPPFLYSFIADIGFKRNSLSIAFGFSFLILLIVYLNYLDKKHRFFPFKSYLPVFVFVVLISWIPNLQRLHPGLFAGFLLFYFVDQIFSTYKEKRVNANVFNAGFSLGLSVFFIPELVFLFPLLFISLNIFRTFDFREWLIAFFAYILVFILMFGYAYVFNGTDFLFESSLKLLDPEPVFKSLFFVDNLSMLIFMFTLFFLVFLSFFLLNAPKIIDRKYLSFFFWFFFICVLILCFFSTHFYVLLFISAIPTGFILTNLMVNFSRNRILPEALLWFLFLSVIYFQYIIPIFSIHG